MLSVTSPRQAKLYWSDNHYPRPKQVELLDKLAISSVAKEEDTRDYRALSIVSNRFDWDRFDGDH